MLRGSNSSVKEYLKILLEMHYDMIKTVMMDLLNDGHVTLEA
jgi:hypothetical protein